MRRQCAREALFFYPEGVALHSPGSRQRTLGRREAQIPTPKGLDKTSSDVASCATPFGVDVAGWLLSQGALTRPWAVESNPFGVGANVSRTESETMGRS